MLGPAQSNVSDEQVEGEQGAGRQEPSGIERRRHPRVAIPDVAVDTGRGGAADMDRWRDDNRQEDRRQGDRRTSDRRQGDRRQGDRRGVDALRSDVQWTVARDTSGGRFAWFRKLGIKPSRLALLGVAMFAGGLAAFIAVQGDRQSAPAAEPVVAEAPPVVKARTRQVLVAMAPIGVGDKVTASAIGWAEWPEASVRPDYLDQTNAPDAVTQLTGQVARHEFLPGEPIREDKLVKGDGSILAATLPDGMRAVSVTVNAEAASGGFVSPDDHVDVVLSRQVNNNETHATVMQTLTVLSNVKVLAINDRLAGQDNAPKDESASVETGNTFKGQAIATLALTPSQAEAIVGASAMGKLSLVMRSLEDQAGAASSLSDANAAIRLTSPFWAK
ncbi:MAG TPA: Flp pilus assembly protein CpaB [Devosiaceae bacterium]